MALISILISQTLGSFILTFGGPVVLIAFLAIAHLLVYGEEEFKVMVYYLVLPYFLILP